MNQKFVFYIDESGIPKPNPKDAATYFAVGGVLIKHQDQSIISENVDEFKKRWNIEASVPLHGNEIRSRKKNFSF